MSDRTFRTPGPAFRAKGPAGYLAQPARLGMKNRTIARAVNPADYSDLLGRWPEDSFVGLFSPAFCRGWIIRRTFGPKCKAHSCTQAAERLSQAEGNAGAGAMSLASQISRAGILGQAVRRDLARAECDRIFLLTMGRAWPRSIHFCRTALSANGATSSAGRSPYSPLISRIICLKASCSFVGRPFLT